MAKHIKSNFISQKDGFLVQVLYLIFYFLERLSVFYWLRYFASRRFKKRSPEPNSEKKPFVMSFIFPEIWAVGNPLFAGFVSFQLLKVYEWKWLAWVLGLYAVERTIELFVYQFNVLFFHRLNNVFWVDDARGTEAGATQNSEVTETSGRATGTEEYRIKSVTRTVLLLIINMIEYVLQFAVMYSAIGVIAADPSMKIGLLMSFQLFMNMSEIVAYSDNSLILPVYIETVIGVFMNVICLARFVGLLPEVKTVDTDK